MRKCCLLVEGCTNEERLDFEISIGSGSEVILRLPLRCFWEMIINDVKDIFLLPGLKIHLNGSGRFDLARFVREGGLCEVAVKLAMIFGGEVREYLFSSEGGRIHYNFDFDLEEKKEVMSILG